MLTKWSREVVATPDVWPAAHVTAAVGEAGASGAAGTGATVVVVPNVSVSLRAASCSSLTLTWGPLLSSSLVYHLLPQALHPLSKQTAHKNASHPIRTLEHLLLSIIRGYTSRYSGARGQGGPHDPQKVSGLEAAFYETVSLH